jgi:acyl-CoA thioester hydrolase
VTPTLDKDQLAHMGIEGGWVLGLPDFVRYGDLDTYNHVNNKVYMAWFENLRTLYMQGLGIDFDDIKDIKPVVRSAYIEFDAAMFSGEEYITLCKTSKLGRTSFTIEYAVWCNGGIRVTGNTAIVMVNADVTATKPVPDAMRDILINRDGATTASS